MAFDGTTAHLPPVVTTIITTYHTDTTFTTAPTEVPSLDNNMQTINFTVLIGAAFLILIIALFVVRYRIGSATYQDFIKRLRRRALLAVEAGGGSPAEPRDEEHFKPPPAYEVAVDMPKPCYCNTVENLDSEVTIVTSVDCPECGKKKRKPDEYVVVWSKPDVEAPSGDENNRKPDSSSQLSVGDNDSGLGFGESSSDTCTVVMPSTGAVMGGDDINSEDSPDAMASFVVLDHVQRMAKNPESSVNSLPSYHEYISVFPQQTEVVHL